MNAFIDLLKRVKRALTRCCIAVFVFLCKLLPIKNRVFFYTIRADGKLLENLDCVYRACDCDRVVFAHMLPHSFFLSLRARKLMLTSRVIVTDDYLKYCRDTKLRKEQKLIQLWHAPGAFKCFALDAPSRLTAAQERATHAQYTDVCVSSEEARAFYARAFGVSIDVVKALGTPRTDALLDETARAASRESLRSRQPALQKKTVYLYAPTFREKDGAPLDFDPQLDFSALDAALGEDEVFVVARHPVMKTPFFAPDSYAHVLDLTNEPTGDLLCCADVLVTDYSSVVFDAALLGVPCVFYCPDRADYERSFYLDFDRDLPGPVLTDASSLLPALRAAHGSPDREKLRAFCKAQMAACDGHATERVTALIRSYLTE